MLRKSLAALALFTAIFLWDGKAQAVPVNCIVCGNTPVGAPGVDATMSFAVISGVDFLAEVATHSIGFFGAVPGGSLDAVPNNTAPSDFVYLYQTVNTGPDPTPLSAYQVSLGILPGLITGGGRLESTLFVDPVLGTVSGGPSGTTLALSAGPTVDFLNGLNGNFGPCLGSNGSVDCSDATANLLPGAIQATNFAEAPAAPLLDPLWTSSIMWYSTPVAPGTGTGTVFDPQGLSASGAIPTAQSVPEPAVINLFLSGLFGMGLVAWRRRRTAA